ncbi:MAG: hypothetical protein JNL18_19060 [Planctomycetaceae bacterium]|nr:hypothetical protein [Planctomycetaceae bacterium]
MAEKAEKNVEMRPSRFSLRRALLSTALIAIGMAAIPLAPHFDFDSNFGDALKFLCLVRFFSLSGAGVGLLFGKPVVGAIAWLCVGVVYVNMFR